MHRILNGLEARQVRIVVHRTGLGQIALLLLLLAYLLNLLTSNELCLRRDRLILSWSGGDWHLVISLIGFWRG